MALTDAKAKNIKPTDKPQKLFDGGGLFLLVAPAGGKWWRLKYRFGGKEKLLSFSQIIHQRCSDLLTIINDILDLAKIESGQQNIKIENCRLRDLLMELHVFFAGQQTRFKKTHISLEFVLPPELNNCYIATDTVKLKQIFTNQFSILLIVIIPS